MDVERTIEFLLSQQVRFDERQAQFDERQAQFDERQAQFEERQARLEEAQLRTETQLDRLAAQQEQTSKEVQSIAGAVHVLIRYVDEDRTAMRELREDVTQVTENVNALVKVVDDIVRRGNGQQHS